MSLRTFVRRSYSAAALVVASLILPAIANPTIGLSIVPGGIRQGATASMDISLGTDTLSLSNATATITLPAGLFATGNNSNFCPDFPASSINAPSGATTITISPVNITTTTSSCFVVVDLATTAAGSYLVSAGPGSFVDPNPSNGSNVGTSIATLCAADPLVVTSTADTVPSTPGTLRAALETSNSPSCPAPTDIKFNIPGTGRQIIRPVAQLPSLGGSGSTIDGYTQPGSAPNAVSPPTANSAKIRIEIEGGSCPGCNGLVLGSNATVRGLAIYNFDGHGIEMDGFSLTVVGNYVGVDANGVANGNGLSGIHVPVTACCGQIGTAAAADANVIGDNPIGIWIEGGGAVTGNQVGGLLSGGAGNGNGVGIELATRSSALQNVVRFSGGPGILVDPTVRDVVLSQNASSANGGPGIDFDGDGPTPNDEAGPPYDTDNTLNYPVITSVERVGGNTIVQGYVKTFPGSGGGCCGGSYTAELYANIALTGQPEGQSFLMAFSPSRDATGFAAFTQTIPGSFSHISASAFADTCGDGCVTSSEYSFASAPALAVSPAAVTFPDRPVNTSSAPVDVTIANAGNETMTISSITVTGDFTLTSSCPPSLAAGDSCVASVTFKPLVLGARSGALTVATDAPSGTQSVRLAGNGLASTDRGILDVSPGLLDFDRIPVGTRSAAQLVTLSNSGVLAINLVVSTVGDFLRAPAPAGATDCDATLAPGEVCEIAVVFAPSAAGAVSGKLVFDSDASNTHVEVSLFGTGAQPAAPARSLVLPDHVSFGTLPVGLRSPASSMILSNATRQPLAITELTITGDFSIGDSCTTVPAGGTCAISLFFTPSARGARTGTLTLRASGDPYVVALDGTGGANLSPVLSVSPLRIGFGNAVIGPASAPASIELRNIGEVPVEIAAPSSLGEFLVTSHCQAALAAGDRCTMDIAFFPRVQGLRAARLEIHSNAVNGPHRVELSGVGCSLPNTARSRISELVCAP